MGCLGEASWVISEFSSESDVRGVWSPLPPTCPLRFMLCVLFLLSLAESAIKTDSRDRG